MKLANTIGGENILSRLRTTNQRLIRSDFQNAEEVLRWMGPMQAQDYTGAKWSMALRAPGLRDRDVEQAINSGRIIRSWTLRSTLHFVSASDVRWITRLTKPIILKIHAGLQAHHGLTEKDLLKGMNALHTILADGEHLTRDEIREHMQKSGIRTDENRLSYILYRGGAEEICCFGPRRGKQFTYTSLEKWVPQETLSDETDSAHRLARIYFRSRGPATQKDFMWWSGFSKNAAGECLEGLKSELMQESVGGKEFYFFPRNEPLPSQPRSPLILPGFDELLLAYSDRSAFIPHEHKHVISQPNGLFSSTVVMKGKVVAVWRRTFKKDRITVEVEPLVNLDREQMNRIKSAAAKFAIFHGSTLEFKGKLKPSRKINHK